MSGRRLGALALLVVLVVAGVAGVVASTSPDGLNAVAEDQGFSSAAEESPTADGPLAGYETRGVEDDRLSSALAGVAGVVVVLVVGGGLFRVLRRREPQDVEG